MQQAPPLPAAAGLALAWALLLAPIGRCGAGSEAAAAVPVQAASGARLEHELTRGQATALVQKRYGARVLRAASAEEAGRQIYVFKLLSDKGRVWTVRIDARSGAELP